MWDEAGKQQGPRHGGPRVPKSEAEHLTRALETVNKSKLSHLLRPTRMGILRLLGEEKHSGMT